MYVYIHILGIFLHEKVHGALISLEKKMVLLPSKFNLPAKHSNEKNGYTISNF